MLHATAVPNSIHKLYIHYNKNTFKSLLNRFFNFTSTEREVKDSRSSGMFQSYNFGTSECPDMAAELVRDIFEFFDLFFQGKEIIMRKYYFWKK